MTLSNLRKNNKFLKSIDVSKLNTLVFHYVSQFTDNEDLLVSALLIKPNSKISKKNIYNPRISRIVNIFDKMQKCDDSLIKKDKDLSLYESKILFLSYYKIVLDKRGASRKAPVLTLRRLQYLLSTLQTIQIYTLHNDLEDRLFELINPGVYRDYTKLRKLSESAYKKHRKEIIKLMKDNFKEVDIQVNIQTRLKSIYSIHSKILRKNTLYSQVLDIMGFRIITESSEDCYRVLSQFLYKWDVISSKVKDFIAMPKDNGYQSIHLTVFYDDFPIEIQIRSENMNQFAEFGRASHLQYKNGK